VCMCACVCIYAVECVNMCVCADMDFLWEVSGCQLVYAGHLSSGVMGCF